LISKFAVQSKFVISYIGAIGIANGLEHMIDCAQACLRAGLHVHFIICGEGGEQQKHVSTIKSMGLTNISVVPFTHRDGVRELLNITDATFISYKPFKILETGSPNKYFDGLAAGKLIIINFGGWIKEEIESIQAGIYIDPKNGIDIVNKLSPYLKSEELVMSYQKAARRLAEGKYSRKKLSADFVDVFKNPGPNPAYSRP
jgi:glycosyltransferase involved in cell wall biosynthesis